MTRVSADIVKQLRDRSLYVCGERPSRWEDDLDLLGEAADEIEHLRLLLRLSKLAWL